MDYLSDRASNMKLINLITQFWRKRGHHVKAWVEKAQDPTNGTVIYVVRTNIKQDASNINPAYTTI